MKIRDAAAHFIGTGRVLGHFERLQQVVKDLRARAEAIRQYGAEADAAARAEAIDETATVFEACITDLDRTAVNHRMAAERLIAELEHPGARLARRVLSSLHAAREAWRAG